MNFPEMPIDFSEIAAQGATILGGVIAGVVGIFVVTSLVNMGIKWLRAAIGGDEEEGISNPYAGTGLGCYDWQDDEEGGGYALMEDGRAWYVSPDDKWTELQQD